MRFLVPHLRSMRHCCAYNGRVVREILQYLDFKPLRDRAFALARDAILQNA